MNRESEFQRTMKWVIYGTAGICVLCQAVLLFYEFSYFNGIGMLFNGLYHLAGIGAPVLVFILFLNMNEDKEVYSSYGLALFTFLGAVVDLVLMVKYFSNLNGTKRFNSGIIIGLVLLLVCEGLFGRIYILYGLDKVTCVLPLIGVVVVSIFRGSMLSVVDSALNTFAYNNVKGTVFSVWTFLHLLFYIAFIICLILYLDSDFLLEIIRNPRELFSKKSFFGTYTNLYIKGDNNKNASVEDNNSMPGSNTNAMNMQEGSNQLAEQSGVAIGKCPHCGKDFFANQSFCTSCGHPIGFVENINDAHSNVESNMPVNEMIADTVCPDCGNKVHHDEKVCPNCGCPNPAFVKK